VRENDGRKLDHQTLEAMRLRAVDAVESGVHPEDVAASLGMGRGRVYGWLAKYREGGREALKARPVPGRPPKLSGEQMRRLYTLIAGADPRTGHTNAVYAVAFAPDGHTLATATQGDRPFGPRGDGVPFDDCRATTAATEAGSR
jgi:transposase